MEAVFWWLINVINQKFLKKIFISSSPENPNFVHIIHSGKKGDSLLCILPSFKYCTVRCCSRKLKYANDGNNAGCCSQRTLVKSVIDSSFLYVLEPSVSYLLFSSAPSSCYTVYFIKIKSITSICWGVICKPFPVCRAQRATCRTSLVSVSYLGPWDWISIARLGSKHFTHWATLLGILDVS